MCYCAREIRECVIGFGDAPARKAFKFLAFAVQSEWLCGALLKMMRALNSPDDLPELLKQVIGEFDRASAKRKIPLLPEEKIVLEELRERRPLNRAIIDSADDWVVGHWQEAARLPNDNEWGRLQKSRLDGKLGVSFALQWRYNFGVFFKGSEEHTNNV